MSRRPESDREVSRESFGGCEAEVSPAAGANSSAGVPWPLCPVWVSMLGSAVTLAAVGVFFSLLYPIIDELRDERVRGEDGTEQRVLGFWSILVLSVCAGCFCCVFSWTVTYVDTYQSGMDPPTPLTLDHFRHISGYHMGCSVAVLNGLMAMLSVIWSLS
ncbi:ADP-ribosylation factor-like protein 6-interacting protein 6 [Genypterus blacodes]|uniref:ADP-ribosylation factor-like protein 6-interacting protein 6 n=1 Tax=Genypterus blacodes TaxID=154954 RepID=UPI003F774BBA